MNDTITHNHNSRVKPEDTTIHVGDFCFRNTKGGKPGEGSQNTAEAWKNRLKGNMVFVRGNHDKNNSMKTIIESLIIDYAGQYIHVCHNPEYVNPDFKINIVGHVHTAWKFKTVNRNGKITDCINCGVDVWKFMPMKIEELMKHYYRWKTCR